jgi:hypothetical protein
MPTVVTAQANELASMTTRNVLSVIVLPSISHALERVPIHLVTTVW